jgi:hypothetical protein
MKNTLHDWGVIDHPRLTRPLREFGSEEVEVLRAKVAKLAHGSQRIAVAA